MSDKKRYKNDNEEGKTYVDGQPREIKSKNDKEDNAKNPLVWVIPIMIVILIVPLLIYHLGSGGGAEEDTALDETAETESGGDSGEAADSGDSEEESDSEGDASSGDVDGEGIARDNCASCHGEDFSGSMGPALAGTDLSQEDFESTVREGQGSMPAFSEDQVSDDELTALYEFFTE